MTGEEYQKKIDELENQICELQAQKRQVKDEFKDSFLRELEVQGITPCTKVLVKTKTWKGDEIETETYFFDLSIVWGEVKYVFNKVKKDGTMSQIRQDFNGDIISIHKI